jgi:hypothetical protein
MVISRSSSLPSFSTIQHSDLPASNQRPLQRSASNPNLRILDELNQIFAGESLQLLCELANRFDRMRVTPDQVQQIVQMLTLPGGIQPPICLTGRPYDTVSMARLLDIISHVAMFDCGVQQLIDLAALCARNDWHLCFLADDRYHNISESLTSGDHYNYNIICYMCAYPIRQTILESRIRHSM